MVPAFAVQECEQIAGRGLRGVEIGSNVEGRNLDADEFRPFFEAAEALGSLS